MFGLFKKNKNINTDEVKSFDIAIKTIKEYLQLFNWGNATKALDEISYKEKKSFNNLMKNLEAKNDTKNEKVVKYEKKTYEEKENKIQELKEVLEKKKSRYLKSIEKERLEIRFKRIENEINNLL
jgi:hypothetical protein